MRQYGFNVPPARSGATRDYLLNYGTPSGWRWMGYEELRDWQHAAQASYVVRPYYPHQGSLDRVFTPIGGDLSTAVAVMRRHIPFPHDLLSYPQGARRTTLGLIRALNLRLPVVVPDRETFGTAAIVDTGAALPGIDLLPEPMRWENPVRTDRYRMLPLLRRIFGRERNLPSGTPLKPVNLAEPDRSYFAPLAIDPAAAAAVLTPALLKLTRELQVGWWCEGSMLFVWTHDALANVARPQLATHAQRIHREILAGQRK